MTRHLAPKAKKKTYICEACKKEYEYGWSEEEAMKEAEELWDESSLAQGTSIICDDCFQEMITEVN